MKDIIEVINKTDDFLTMEDNENINEKYIKIVSRDCLARPKIEYNIIHEPMHIDCKKIYMGAINNILMSHAITDISFISSAKNISNDRWFISTAYLMHANKKRKRIDIHPDCRLYIPYGSEVGYCLMNHNDSLILEVSNEPRKMHRGNIYEIDYDIVVGSRLYWKRIRFNGYYSIMGINTEPVEINQAVHFEDRVNEDMEKLRLSFYKKGENNG